jgi:hypothetical protein
MKKMYKKVLTALAVVCGIMLAACGNPAGGGENNGNGATMDSVTGNITFGAITNSSSQEQVTGTIEASLELLQSQTQNIINKLTEYKTNLQEKLAAAATDIRRDEIMLEINAVTNIITNEKSIASAQQDRYTEQGLNNMYSSYFGLITSVNILQLNPIDKSLLNNKIRLYQTAVTVDGRNIITNNQKATSFNNMRQSIESIKDLETQKGNENYYLPDPETNMYGLKQTLETENKQKLNNLLGQYGQYIFYQGQDIAEYAAISGDARALGKEVNLPRSVVQRLSVAEMVKEINAPPAGAQEEVGR